MPTSFIISVHEHSGDRATADLVRALREHVPDVAVAGLGGPALREAGMMLWRDMVHASHMGISEIVGEVRGILRHIRETADRIARLRPDVVIAVDAPDYNIRLAKRLKRIAPEIPVVYFLCPQIWAWRTGRVAQLRRYFDARLCLFRFEVRWFNARYTEATFIGHPLVDRVRAYRAGLGAIDFGDDLQRRARVRLGIDNQQPVLGIIPGSRPKEIRPLLPQFARAARLVREQAGAKGVTIPVSGTEGRDPRVYIELLKHSDAPPGCLLVHPNLDGYQVIDGIPARPGTMHDVAAAADGCLTASGTAALETAYLNAPQVVGYRVSWFTEVIGRLLVDPNLDFVSTVNLLMDREVVPELLQAKCSPARLADTVAPFVFDPAPRQRVRRLYQELRRILGPPGASQRAAAEILQRFLPVRNPGDL